jgi:hypothetical protein
MTSGRRFTQGDAVKWVQDLWVWANNEQLVSMLQGKPFIWYEYFKKYVFLTKGIDKHTVYAYRDTMRLYGLLEFDVFEHVFFVFKDSPIFKQENNKMGLGGWVT